MVKALREIVPLNELSKKTLGSYIKGAAIKHMEISDDEQEARRRKEDVGRIYDRKRERLGQGVENAVTRLVHGEYAQKSKRQRKYRWKPYQFKEENINELSKRTLGNYIQTATGGGVYPSRLMGMSQLGGMLFNKKYSKREREGVSHFAGNRSQGIDRATERLTGEKKGYKFKGKSKPEVWPGTYHNEETEPLKEAGGNIPWWTVDSTTSRGPKKHLRYNWPESKKMHKSSEKERLFRPELDDAPTDAKINYLGGSKRRLDLKQYRKKRNIETMKAWKRKNPRH